MKLTVFVLMFLLVLLSFTLTFASGEGIPWWSIHGGGVINLSSGDKFGGSTAQTAIGKATGAYTVYFGFWTPWVVQMSPVEGEESDLSQIPDHFDLGQNYPNPFNPTTVIEYALPKRSNVQITIYNVCGQKVRVLKDETEEAGYKSVVWDGKDGSGAEVATGIYFYRIMAKDYVKTKKMTLIK
jgi:hypothetical protein